MSGYRIDASDMISGMADWFERAEKGMQMFAETAAIKMAGRMRDSAPWTDRTGHARQRLTGYSSRVANGFRITLSHGVWYGVYLEYAHEQRFAIIDPTIMDMGVREVVPAWQKLTFQIVVR